jgi:hypothetical protein
MPHPDIIRTYLALFADALFFLGFSMLSTFRASFFSLLAERISLGFWKGPLTISVFRDLSDRDSRDFRVSETSQNPALHRSWFDQFPSPKFFVQSKQTQNPRFVHSLIESLNWLRCEQMLRAADLELVEVFKASNRLLGSCSGAF